MDAATTMLEGARPLLLLTILIATACAQPPPTVHLPHPNEPLEVGKGEQLSFTLDANPTTGFTWQLAAPLDETVIALVSHDYQPPDTSRVGAGGTDVWTFKAVGTGRTTITLEYRRPWEKDVPPADRKTYSVVVR